VGKYTAIFGTNREQQSLFLQDFGLWRAIWLS
jgi:hypothetical protein